MRKWLRSIQWFNVLGALAALGALTFIVVGILAASIYFVVSAVGLALIALAIIALGLRV